MDSFSCKLGIGLVFEDSRDSSIDLLRRDGVGAAECELHGNGESRYGGRIRGCLGEAEQSRCKSRQVSRK